MPTSDLPAEDYVTLATAYDLYGTGNDIPYVDRGIYPYWQRNGIDSDRSGMWLASSGNLKSVYYAGSSGLSSLNPNRSLKVVPCIHIANVDGQPETTISLEDFDVPPVYGGTFDVTNGVLTVTHDYIESYNGEVLPGEWISSMDEYVEGTSPSYGAEVIYELAEPIVYNIDPTDINTSLGTNSIIVDSGDIEELVYRADPTMVFQALQDQIQNLISAT